MKSLESQVSSLEDQNEQFQEKIQQLTRQLAAAKEDAQNQRESRREESNTLQNELQETVVWLFGEVFPGICATNSWQKLIRVLRV